MFWVFALLVLLGLWGYRAMLESRAQYLGTVSRALFRSAFSVTVPTAPFHGAPGFGFARNAR